MALVFHCQALGFESDAVMRAESEDELLNMVARYAKKEHEIEKLSDEAVEKVKSMIQEE